MFRPKFLLLLGMAVFAIKTSPVFALIGIGAHYGIDLTLKMDNKMEQTDFSDLKFKLQDAVSLPSGYNDSSILTGKDIPVYVNRKDWKNTGINFGGKIYVDVIPFIDALEISTNFGVWQYNGSIIYPKSISINPTPAPNASKFTDLASIDYDTLSLTLKQLYPDRFFWGVTETPYAKLHFDLTVRKYLLQVPPIVKILKVYGGAGMTVDFATPMLSSKLVEDAIGSTLDGTYTMAGMKTGIFDQNAIMKKIIDRIIDNMMTPHYGCHLALGTMIKLPMVPVGLYADAKYIIQFDKLDKYVDIGGSGFLINLGLAFAL
jgi:hypothetical protein